MTSLSNGPIFTSQPRHSHLDSFASASTTEVVIKWKRELPAPVSRS
jgi:hypothetical protein